MSQAKIFAELRLGLGLRFGLYYITYVHVNLELKETPEIEGSVYLFKTRFFRKEKKTKMNQQRELVSEF